MELAKRTPDLAQACLSIAHLKAHAKMPGNSDFDFEEDDFTEEE